MDNILAWIQSLPIFVTIAESPSVWGYPTVLMLHTVGLGWLVGLSTVVNLRLLGVGRQVPFAMFEKLFPMMWWGFWLNLSTGLILFALDAPHRGHQWIFGAKLAAVVVAMVLLTREQRFTEPLPGRARGYAWAMLALWAAATATGRLTAYVG